MVESTGTTPLTGGDRSVARIAATTSSTTVRAPVQTSTSQTASQVSSQVEPEPSATSSIAIARTMAASAPINDARIAAVKKAVANGTFPILPTTIADRLLAFRLEWSPNDPA